MGKLSLRCPNRYLKGDIHKEDRYKVLTLDSPSVNWANNPSSLNGCVWVGGWGSDEIKGVAVVST